MRDKAELRLKIKPSIALSSPWGYPDDSHDFVDNINNSTMVDQS